MTIGLLPFLEFRLRLRRRHESRVLAARENEVVESLRSQIGSIPPADVVTIIATYRRPDQLPLAVASALAQTVDDQRVVVIDDGGGLEAVLADDPRLTILSLPANVGVAGIVRNVGIRLTSSRLLAFLDDDNTWEPSHLEVSLPFHATGPALTYSDLRRVDPDGRQIDLLTEPFSRRAMRQRSLVDTNSIVVRRTDQVRFSSVPRRRQDPGEDWELVWRLSRFLPVTHVPKTTVNYLVHPGSHFSNWGQAPEDPNTVSDSEI